MSRLQCLGKSSTGSQKQLASQVITFAHAETHTPSDKVGEKTVNDKPRRTLPALALPRSAQVPCKETQKCGFQSGAALNTGVEYTPKKSMNKTQREEEQAQSTAVLGEEPKIKDLRKAQHPDSAGTGGTTHTPPAVEPLPTHGVEEWQAEDEDIKTPVTLKMKFLMAVMGRNLQLASKLCQMILIYEPHNPEASEFLPLIKKRLLEEQEAEQSEEDDDSSCSSSSSSSPSDDEAEEKPGTKHKPCPPCKVCP